MPRSEADRADAFDSSSDRRFIDYYAKESQSVETTERFARIMARSLQLFSSFGAAKPLLDVVDVGCGAGTQARLWSRAGHRVRAIDINASLVTVAQRRAHDERASVDFCVGSASQLPFATESADVVLIPELLEHVDAWEQCLLEASRVLRRPGLLYLSTTNRLCPKQQEFTLPMYSWYPQSVKKWCEHRAVTTRPEWVEYARYPAINWFTYFGLRDWFELRGFRTLDRFDVLALGSMSTSRRFVAWMVGRVPGARFLGHVLTEGTTVWAIKNTL